MSKILSGELQCQTCREHVALYVASLEGETWVACTRCREMAVRVKSKATFRPIGRVEVTAGTAVR